MWCGWGRGIFWFLVLVIDERIILNEFARIRLEFGFR
jgi:hypothetical protein